MSAPRIALIDSGVGGLTLVQSIRQRYPSLSIIYANDNANFPYGPRSELEVVELVQDFVNRLLRNYQFDALVVGCNTASTVALPALRAYLPIPVIGVVPAIKPAALLTKSGHVGLLATEGTVRRQYTKDLISDFAANCQVHMVGSNDLVQFAERKLRGKDVDQAQIDKIVMPFIQSQVDVVVLGCTHFPLLRQELAQTLGPDCVLLDSGEAIAQRVGQVLNLGDGRYPIGNGEVQVVFSAVNSESESLRAHLKSIGIEVIASL